ncbi:mercuric reductase [Christiangramia fulva]|uniref:Mercuric reductase n=1 Tax=Christiangramia fulva TaxID=2126553 RepID=A0A2R3Z4A2_9FLAO|nr:FAD-dependent oxidoreductase [Christiangramia fulva]AVR45100.1 mercuric reductase [Christiangramia fulva]
MNKDKYDLIVLGAGSGGLGAALGINKLGLNVLLIDRNAEKLGGECLNTGCVPSKALIHLAKQIQSARNARKLGLELSGEVSIAKIKDYVQEKQKAIKAHENLEYLQGEGIDVELGEASFHSKNSIQVNGNIFQARNIIIATGSYPTTISIEGAENIPVFTNESIFDIDFIPENFLFLGGGPVSLELGQVFSRFGSRVSLVERGKRILKKEDPSISRLLQSLLEKEGMEFYLNSEVNRVINNEAVVVQKSGKENRIPIDAIFMGLGRNLDFSSLKLENAGIETKDGKIILNEKLQTTNKRIFVSGDAADNLKFSHAAEMHNMLLINNFISPFPKKLKFKHFSWVTFTDPEVAHFGLNEDQLQKKKIKYTRLESNFSSNDRAVIDDYEFGKLIIYVEKKSFYFTNARVLGGCMLAPNAGEIIQELILANSAGIKLNAFMNKIYPYPTAANIHKILIREYMIDQLKPWMKGIIKILYRLN